MTGAVVRIGAVGEAAQRRGGAELQRFAGELTAALGAEQQRGDGAGGNAARHAAAEAVGECTGDAAEHVAGARHQVRGAAVQVLLLRECRSGPATG